MSELNTISMTESAAKRIATVLAAEPEGSMLRITVDGGGCSGFQYKFDFTREKQEDDTVLSRDGATVLVDTLSLQYMTGTELDWVDDLMGSSFKLNNPQATASCGCGTSFSV